MVVGLLIFDWLGLMNIRQDFAPVLRLVGIEEPQADTETLNITDGSSLNDVRLRQQLESLELQRKSLEEREKKLIKRANELDEKELALTEVNEQLQQRLKSLEERENLYRERNNKIQRIARNFSGMPPAQAVAQMNEMDALLVVDILRAADEIAAQENTNSLVSFWISQMPAVRGAEINKLLVEKP